MNAVKEPSELQVALDKRERLLDSLTDQVVSDVESLVKSVVGEAYEEGFEAGILQGIHDADEEFNDGGGPIGELIATVKEFQVRCPNFEPLERWSGPTFYDHLIYFLEEGVLPPEWQP